MQFLKIVGLSLTLVTSAAAAQEALKEHSVRPRHSCWVVWDTQSGLQFRSPAANPSSQSRSERDGKTE
jgi:hypothetical protein